MLVYGDAARREAPADKVARLHGFLRDAAAADGIRRHGLLVAALIEAGELAQGVADAAFRARGERDARDAGSDAAMALAMAVAALVVVSWRSGFAAPLGLARAEASLDALNPGALPPELDIKQPEGFAFYALYPEAYAEAAAALPRGRTTVIGLRSIGTTLAATLAAALGAATPTTVRPVGHPFHRELATDPVLDAELSGAVPGPFAVADEGPGLSGSSFLAAARHLGRLGASPGDVHLFPSHANPPGPEAGDAARAAWLAHPRHLRATDDLLFGDGAPGGGLPGWVADLVGPPVGPLRDISGGGWRRLRFASEAEWPPVHAWQERRKYLCETSSGTWLVRFAGLGRAGLAKEARGRALAAAGFVPAIAGWRHGFLVERWHADARVPALAGEDRAAFVARLGQYLGARAAAFPAAPDSGASLEALRAMALHNAGQALGPDAGGRLGRALSGLAAFAPRIRRVETDNRLQAWEWLAVGDAILKADALDHAAGHDLVGCQDVAWDLAGAAEEFGLGPSELEHAMAQVERSAGRPVDPTLVGLLRPVYLAFQLGACTMAAGSASDEERPRLTRRSGVYARQLDAHLCTATYNLRESPGPINLL